ncbi:hypothetical protein V8C34DRAFT_97120 [Trichoderma compactum]
MSVAIRLMRFKYLHILVLTLPEDFQYAPLRLKSSREALSLLPHLSSKHHVYRGAFWTLLYYPSTSFSCSSTILRVIQRHRPRAKI